MRRVLCDLPAELLVEIWRWACEVDAGPALQRSKVYRLTRAPHAFAAMLVGASTATRERVLRRLLLQRDVLARVPLVVAALEAGVVPPTRPGAAQFDRFDLVVLAHGQLDWADRTTLFFRALTDLGARGKNATPADHERLANLLCVLLGSTGGASVSAAEEFALMYCCAHGLLDLAKLMRAHGADVRFSHDEALRWAAARGHVAVVQWLIDCGADVHARDADALRSACFYGQQSVVELLVDEYGADVHALQDEALWQAVAGGNDGVASTLLERGADPSGRFSQLTLLCFWYGRVSLFLRMMAMRWIKCDVVRLLKLFMQHKPALAAV